MQVSQRGRWSRVCGHMEQCADAFRRSAQGHTVPAEQGHAATQLLEVMTEKRNSVQIAHSRADRHESLHAEQVHAAMCISAVKLSARCVPPFTFQICFQV